MNAAFEVAAPDGRTLLVHDAGAPDGRVVLGHHGTPGSGLPYPPHAELARERGLRLVSYDRPGYGGSSPHRGRSVADAAADVATILDALGAEPFATWGASGGGPHALACAALLPGRCAAAVTLAGVAPREAAGLDWLAGQGEDNLQEWAAAEAGRDENAAFCATFRQGLLTVTGEEIAGSLQTLLSPVDVACVTDRLGAHLAAVFRDALREGVEGWVDDDQAFIRPWGFDLAAITVPVLVWQGRQDLMVPPAHGAWLAEHVAGAERRLTEEDGHLTLTERGMAAVLDHLGRYTF